MIGLFIEWIGGVCDGVFFWIILFGELLSCIEEVEFCVGGDWRLFESWIWVGEFELLVVFIFWFGIVCLGVYWLGWSCGLFVFVGFVWVLLFCVDFVGIINDFLVVWVVLWFVVFFIDLVFVGGVGWEVVVCVGGCDVGCVGRFCNRLIINRNIVVCIFVFCW